MAEPDDSLEDMLKTEQPLSEKQEDRAKKPKKKLPGKAAAAIIGVLGVGGLCLGAAMTGLYLTNRAREAAENNPAITLIETMNDIGQGIKQDFEELGDYVSSLGFVQGVQEFVDEKVVVPWNTIVPIYGNPMTIPLNEEVFVATDTYINLRIDQSTNKFFGNIFKVVPETVLQYNGDKPVVIYDIDQNVIPAAVTEKTMAPGETLTIQGVSLIVEPRLSTGEIVVQRQTSGNISYDFEIAYKKPSELEIKPFTGTKLEELAEYLVYLGQMGIDFQLNKTIDTIELDTMLSVNLGMPDVTIDQLQVTNSRYQSDALNKFDEVTQDLWAVPGLMAFDKFVDWLSNFEGQAKAFTQIYMNVPRWTEEAKAIPGYEQLPIAELKTISSPTEDVKDVPMPEYFPSLWKETTRDEITSIYMEMVKLVINAGVNQSMSCSSDMDKLNELLDSVGGEDFMAKYDFGVGQECKIDEATSIKIYVPSAYVEPLEEKLDAYISEMKKADASVAGGIDYSSLNIIVERAPETTAP